MSTTGTTDIERLLAIDASWVAVSRPLQLDAALAPSNLAQERVAFLSKWQRGEAADPQFVFKPPDRLDASPIESFRRRLHPAACDIEAIYDRLAGQTLSLLAFLKTRDPAQLTATTADAYGVPDPSLITRGTAILEQPPPPPSSARTMDSCAVAERLRAELAIREFTDWSVREDPLMNARISVDPLRREVKVRVGTTFHSDAIERLLVHELGVHVHRAHHGSRQPLPLLGRGLPGYLATEEGLAVWHEDRAGLLDPATLRTYAARVLAADAALSAGFSEVFRVVEPYVGSESAFEITARAKRGLEDSSRPGAHTKDHLYLRGFVEVSEHLASNWHDLPALMSAKIGIGDLGWFRSLVARGLASIADIDPGRRMR